MKKLRWHIETINYFVHLYKIHECLWNNKHHLYFDNTMQAAAVADIQSKMMKHSNIKELDFKIIKRRISSLKSKYYAARKRYKYSSYCPSTRVGNWYTDIDTILKKTVKRSDNLHDNDNITDLDMPSTSQNTEGASTDSALNKPETIDKHVEELSRDVESLNEDKNRLLPECRNSELKSFTLSFQSRLEVMNVLKKLYIENVLPTFSYLFEILNRVLESQAGCPESNYEEFQKKMYMLGYIEKETVGGTRLIIENPEQRFARFLYLAKIMKIRDNEDRQVVYIDERIINLKLNFEKLINTEDVTSESSIFFHAVSKDGLISGLFCYEATEENFNKWITDIVLSILKSPCVIIMDNGPLHGKLEEHCPITRYSTKSDMLKWLRKNNIPCSFNLSKPELYELIDRNKSNIKQYQIDKLIRSHGHDVLRLPDRFSGLNITDILWRIVHDNKVAKSFNCRLLPKLQTEIMGNVLPTIITERWSDMESRLASKEHDMYNIDATVEFYLDSIMFK